MKPLGKPVAVLAGIYFFSQCLFAYEPEKGFWAQRRQAAKDHHESILARAQGAGAVASLSSQFPVAQSVTPSQSKVLAKSFPAPFLKDHADLLNALSTVHGSIRKISLPKSGFTAHPPHPVLRTTFPQEGKEIRDVSSPLEWKWKEKRDIGRKGVPFRPVVVHIQDVHMNLEAQRNIRETVRLLLESNTVDLVGLEGSTEEIDLQPFVDFPSRRAVEVSADFVLKQNKITGPVHAAMTAHGKLPRFIGVDDPVHYPANVQAYRDAEPRLDRTRKRVEELLQKLDQEKRTSCSPALSDFDTVARSFEDQKVSLGDYVLALKNRRRTVPNTVDRFAQALVLERSLDFQRVESERAALIGVLANRLNPEEIRLLLAHSAAYRAGSMGYGAFYDHLLKLCRSKDVALSQYPVLDAYVRYVLLADAIDAEQLYEDLSRLEKSIYESLAVTALEKDWVSRCREGRLLKKLVNFSMTPADWKEYELSAGRPEWAPFEAFYKEAQIRDRAMADNLLKALRAEDQTTAVLVTGGFHAKGIADRLTAQGATVLSYVPKIEKIDTNQGSAYLSVFSQEKTPLEKLFAGEKLFLGDNPARGIPEAAVLANLVGGVGVPSALDRSKFEGYLTRYYQGRRLVFGEHSQRPDGSWVATVHLQAGNETSVFSVVYKLIGNEISIQSFGLAEKEVRPSFGAFVEKFIGLHRKLGAFAGMVSRATEFPLFLLIPWWTPANFLWFARRHQAGRSESVSLLLGWMAIHALSRNHHTERAAVWEKIVAGLRLGLFQHPFWNGLGLFTLAANKSVKEASSSATFRVHPADPAHPGYQELKVLGSHRMEAVINGGEKLIARMIYVRRGKYLLLKKPEKGTSRIKLDIPGGGAAGQELGINILEGAQREAYEELKLSLGGNKINKSQDLGLGRSRFRLYSIPGPKTNFTKRRPTVFRRIELDPQKDIRIRTSSEHKGHLWVTLPEVLERFEDLNTGPKMAFYLEFLREAYGITRVRSLRVLTETRRLKSMTDPVLIETDRGSFVWCPNGEVKQFELGDYQIDQTMSRITSEKSVLAGWENPKALREIGAKILPVPMVMWRLNKATVNLSVPEFVLPNGSASTNLDRSRARINFLVTGAPRGEPVRSSVRVLVRHGDDYVFLSGYGHKHQCPGGVEIANESLPELLQNQLGTVNAVLTNDQISVGDHPFLTHKVGDGAHFDYFNVQGGVLDLSPSVLLSNEKLIKLSYEELKHQYYDFTLATRMSIVKEIVFKEYGLQVSSIKPVRPTEGSVDQISLATEKGTFVFRKANTIVDRPTDAIPVLKKPDGSNGVTTQVPHPPLRGTFPQEGKEINEFPSPLGRGQGEGPGRLSNGYYVNIGGTNFILVRSGSGVNRYAKISNRVREQEAAVQRGDWTPHFRAIAQNIKTADIWKEVLEAQTRIPFNNKTDGSPVTEWDYKLQLAFLGMIQKTGLPAHVVGEESPLNKAFLDNLSLEDQDRVINLVFNNAANVPEGLVFFVDPIDGTGSFKEGRKEFAFTFGVLYNGKPLYAATYLPAHDILYEAVAQEKAIYKNGERVTPKPPTASDLIKVQRGLQARWQTAAPSGFQNVDHSIPSIAVVSARMAAGEEGAASGLVLNAGGVFPWDFVPASIFLLVAGYRVVDFKGQPVLSTTLRLIRKGVPPRQLVSQVLVARSGALEPLLRAVHKVLRVRVSPETSGPGRATSLWITKFFEIVGGWVDNWYGDDKSITYEKSFKERFGLHYKRNAPRYEWGFAAMAMVANLVWGGGALGGWVFAGLFALSHIRLFQIQTDVVVSPFKVVVMAALYGSLVVFSPDILLSFIGDANPTHLANLLLTGAVWHGAYGLHRQFDPPWRTAQRATSEVLIKPLSLSYWAFRYFGVSDTRSRIVGGVEMLLQIPVLVGLRIAAEVNDGVGVGMMAFVGLDPFWGSLFVIGLIYLYWFNFYLMTKVADGEGNDPPPLKQLVGPLTVSLFLLPTHIGLAIGAFSYLCYFMIALVDQKPEPKRILSAPEETKKNKTIRLLTGLPDGVDQNSEDVLSVRILVRFIEDTLWGEREKFLFVKNQDGRWEVPGGGGKRGETIPNAALREIQEELGKDFMKVLRGFSRQFFQTHQFVHSIENKKGGKSFRAVSVVRAEPKYAPEVRLNDESLAHKWMTLKQAMRMYMGFTLNTRLTLLNPILESEFGIKDIVSIVPFNEVEKSDVEGNPLLIKTSEGKEYILRHIEQKITPPEGKTVRPVSRRKTFFQRSDTLVLSRQPMALEEVIDARGSKAVDDENLPDLTGGQRDITREVLSALEGRPILLGVEDFRASVLRVAEAYSWREGGKAVDLAAPARALGGGTKLFLVDPVSLKNSSYVGKLNEILKNDQGVLLVVPGNVSGFPEGRVLLVPEAFEAIDNNGKSIFDVALEKVELHLPGRVRNMPLQIVQTPFLKLNYENLSDESEILKAKKSALVIVLESMRTFSAESFRWGDVLEVMRALAQAA